MDRFTRSFLELRPKLLERALKLCGDADTAEDLVQDVYVLASSKADPEAEAAAWNRWLFRILLNRYLNWRELSANRETSEWAEENPELAIDAPWDELTADEIDEEIQRRLDLLSPRDQQLLKMVLDGDSIEDAADRFGMRESSFRNALERAKAKVRQRAILN